MYFALVLPVTIRATGAANSLVSVSVQRPPRRHQRITLVHGSESSTSLRGSLYQLETSWGPPYQRGCVGARADQRVRQGAEHQLADHKSIPLQMVEEALPNLSGGEQENGHQAGMDGSAQYVREEGELKVRCSPDLATRRTSGPSRHPAVCQRTYERSRAAGVVTECGMHCAAAMTLLCKL